MRILPSHHSYEKINELWNMYALVKNPHMFLGSVDLENYQIIEIMEILENSMQDVLDGIPVSLIYNIAESS